MREDSKKSDLKRFNKRVLKKVDCSFKDNKNRKIQREIVTIYFQKTYKEIKEYLEDGKYPDEVLSVTSYEAKIQRKCEFIQIIDNRKRSKFIQFKINRTQTIF